VLTKRFERCQWQCDDGCRIYEHRPEPCAQYHCMWRLGWADDSARPDRLGILCEGSPNGWLFVLESRPGGAEEPEARAWMELAIQASPGDANMIHVTPWGDTSPRGGYWITDRPELVENPELLREELRRINHLIAAQKASVNTKETA
jgi:hypothetical protein